MKILKLDNWPVLKQLELEEALLRANDDNWCIINQNSPPTIVMGLSAKPEHVINLQHLVDNPIPAVKRFSGGGTVVIDPDTLLITFIVNGQAPTPDKIHAWAESFYKPLLPSSFALLQNDYVHHNRKFGGNAQYIRKNRWLHHTSFLWDYNPALMQYLQIPAKQPVYRQNRDHSDFLCRMKDFLPCRTIFLEDIVRHVERTHGGAVANIHEAIIWQKKEHRKSICLFLPMSN